MRNTRGLQASGAAGVVLAAGTLATDQSPWAIGPLWAIWACLSALAIRQASTA